MAEEATFSETVKGQNSTATGYIGRRTISAAEHQMIVLPRELINEDGSLNLYEDVQRLFRPSYQNNRPVIQCGGWVGYIPLNDDLALEVSTRVPVGNLERLIGMSRGYSPNVLRKYTRWFGHSHDRPEFLLDIIADQLLDIFDDICRFGLLKAYDQIRRVSSLPNGRIAPFESEWRSVKAGRPIAVSTHFHRTINCFPNQVLLYAFKKLLGHNLGLEIRNQLARTRRLRLAINRLNDVAPPLASQLEPRAVATFLQHLPVQHQSYADALMLAQLLIFDAGVSIRGSGATAVLPTMLIDMSAVFETYVLQLLADDLGKVASVEVKNGNKGGDGGAKVTLFDPVAEGIKNPLVTPDIVVEVDGAPKLIIDAKYKPAPDVPDRSDINQVVLYGTKYGASRIMVLHAGRTPDRPPVERCGSIGSLELFNGMIDLSAEPIEAEEAHFVSAVRELL